MTEVVATDFHVEDRRLVVTRAQDVEGVLEMAVAAHNEGLNVTGMGDKWAASFPPVIVENYCNRNRITFAEWMQNPDHVKAMLNDPALSAFRPWKGRV